MFTERIELIISNGVSTIGGKDLIKKLIGTVSWSWTDEEGKLHTKKLNNLIYFPDSPVNILSGTVLDEIMKDDEGTFVLTKRKISMFTWGLGEYKNTIAHSKKYLPELEIQSVFRKFAGFCNRVGSISRYPIFNFSFCLHMQKGGYKNSKSNGFYSRI